MTNVSNGSANGHSKSANMHCVLTGKEALKYENRPIPQCKPDQVLVKVMTTGIDLSYYTKGGIGTTVVKAPLVLGHESCGVVTEVGSEVKHIKEGDRVAIEPALPCRTCRFCKDGQWNYCQNDQYMASPPTDGTLCQWYACPATNAVKIPDNISWEESGCIQPLAIAIQVARRSGLRAHQNVVVFGCGPLGLLCMAVAKAYGASRIIAIDISEHRLKFAKSYAATHHFLPSRAPENVDTMQWNRDLAAKVLAEAGLDVGVDVVIEASGAAPCMQLGIECLRTGGTCMGAPLASFPILQVATKELNVLGTLRYTNRCFEDGIDLLSRGLVSLKPLITKTFPLQQSEDAFKAVKSGAEIKIVIMNQE
ncbi:hypothetical protein IAU60_004297 [Kwoniella sp. DSM 27419]